MPSPPCALPPPSRRSPPWWTSPAAGRPITCRHAAAPPASVLASAAAAAARPPPPPSYWSPRRACRAVQVIVPGLSPMPNGIAYSQGDLFIASLDPYKSCKVRAGQGLPRHGQRRRAHPPSAAARASRAARRAALTGPLPLPRLGRSFGCGAWMPMPWAAGPRRSARWSSFATICPLTSGTAGSSSALAPTARSTSPLEPTATVRLCAWHGGLVGPLPCACCRCWLLLLPAAGGLPRRMPTPHPPARLPPAACRLDGSPPNNGYVNGQLIYNAANAGNTSHVTAPFT